MGYTNSKLVNYIKLSPNNSGLRKHAIDTITIHCYVGQVTVQQAGERFSKTNVKASCNYVVDKDGKIGLIVEEKNRSWCTSSSSNDNRSVTIEVASGTTEPYNVTDEAYNSLIRLCADICKRNNISKLLWEGNKSLIGDTSRQNMTVHKWFANKACPGTYLYNSHQDIVAKVNSLLGLSGWWIKDSYGWWWRNSDGSYPVKCWKKINNKWYYFNEKGYALTSEWLHYENGWYYFNNNSSMVTGWNKVNGLWYYMSKEKTVDYKEGECVKGFITLEEQTYYMYPSKVGNNPECSMALGWVNIDNKWYYFNENYNCQSVGSMLKNHWINKSNKSYYIKENGVMAQSETITIDGKTYRFNINGELC